MALQESNDTHQLYTTLAHTMLHRDGTTRVQQMPTQDGSKRVQEIATGYALVTSSTGQNPTAVRSHNQAQQVVPTTARIHMRI